MFINLFTLVDLDDAGDDVVQHSRVGLLDIVYFVVLGELADLADLVDLPASLTPLTKSTSSTSLTLLTLLILLTPSGSST